MRYKQSLFIVSFLIMLLGMHAAHASHIIGGEMTYKLMGNAPGGNAYRITLTIYEDCINGDPGAIRDDNPAAIAVFDAVTNAQLQLDSVYYASVEDVPSNFSNSCVTDYPKVCARKKVFVKDYVLAPNAHGYVITYQKCCRNLGIVNVTNSGSAGSTYLCVIPPSILQLQNSTALFKGYPPLVICMNSPLTYDHSATDPDGDSLSYEFGNSLIAHGNRAPYPLPAPPPYDSVTWLEPAFSPGRPMPGFPAIVIDPVSGIITGTPNMIGRFMVIVACHEWRNGIMINTTTREFQFVVTNCSRAVLANMPQYSTEPNTYILNCADYTVHFDNTSKGGYAWSWDFGNGETIADTSTEFQPSYTYPDTGIYIVKLRVNPGGTCQDSIAKKVKIYPTFKVAFADTGHYCPGMPVSFKDRSVATIKPVTGWSWSFGDGAIAAEQNPVHTFLHGGTYNVVLTSGTAKGCVDTALGKVVIDNFQPFAGEDTTIVKGESIIFSAQGGVNYKWWPDSYLSSTDIGDPRGYFPDTGHYNYSVQVESAYGCKGQAYISVWVVDHANFFVPNAFTPNGDGLNDIFRPTTAGYTNIKYFKVYNRFGEQVYTGSNLQEGWDGTCNHRQADVGVYFWTIVYTNRFGKEGAMKGDVTLIR